MRVHIRNRRTDARQHSWRYCRVCSPLAAAWAGAVSLNGQSTPTVLFMCPHDAAKSVLASAYFERLAKERGLNVRVVSAGTDSDSQVAPKVADHLTKKGTRCRLVAGVTGLVPAGAMLKASAACLRTVMKPSSPEASWGE